MMYNDISTTMHIFFSISTRNIPILCVINQWTNIATSFRNNTVIIYTKKLPMWLEILKVAYRPTHTYGYGWLQTNHVAYLSSWMCISLHICTLRTWQSHEDNPNPVTFHRGKLGKQQLILVPDATMWYTTHWCWFGQRLCSVICFCLTLTLQLCLLRNI